MIQQSAKRRAEYSTQNARLADSQLIVQIGQGNEPALGALYDRYSALVYSVALHITQDRALAEKAVQGVFYTVWQSASSMHLGMNVPVWLMGLAHQWALAAKGLPEPQSPVPIARRSTQGAYTSDPLAMGNLLSLLPYKQRETLELAYYERLTCHEIAARLCEPVGTIKALLRAALGTLAKAQNTVATNVSHSHSL